MATVMIKNFKYSGTLAIDCHFI